MHESREAQARAEEGRSRSGPSVPALRELNKRRSEKWDGIPSDVIASTVAEMDFALAEPIREVLHQALQRDDLGYAYAVSDELRSAFVGFAERRLAWTVDPRQLTLVPDVMVGIIEAARVLAPAGSPVVFASPSYPPFAAELPDAGVPIRRVAARVDGGLDLGAIEREFAAGAHVFLLANPHNPLGRVATKQELVDLADLVAGFGGWVIADEIHAPLTLPGAVHTPWLEVSDAARENGLVLTSASKAFNVAGLKAGLLVTASDRVRSRIEGLPYMGERCGLLGVLAAEAAFSEGDDWLDGVIAQLESNRQILVRELRLRLPEVRWSPPQASFLAWLDCRALNLGADPAQHFLDRGRVALDRGLDYGPQGSGFVRLNFGTSAELVRSMIERIAASMSRLE